MAKNIKLVAESLQEWQNTSNSDLNEKMFGLVITKKEAMDAYNKLDKNNEAAIREFANKYIAKLGVTGNNLNILKNTINKMPIDKLKQIIEKAVKDNFSGGFTDASGTYKTQQERKPQSVVAGGAGHSAGSF